MEDFENPDITEIKFLNYKIESGKYKDRFLVTMFTVDEIYHVNRIKNIYTDFWCENYLRYSFLKKELNDINIKEGKVAESIKHDDIEKLIELVNNLYYNKDLFLKYKSVVGTDKLISCIELLGSVVGISTIADKAKELKTDYNNVKCSAMPKVTLFGVKFVIDNE